MKRRSFLQALAHAVGIGAVPGAVRAAPSRRVELQRSPLAGFQYHARGEGWLSLAVGDALTLVREPDNPHDVRAVRVEWRCRKLGYLPRVENAAVAHLLDAGHLTSARIVALRDSGNPWKRVELAAYLHSGG